MTLSVLLTGLLLFVASTGSTRSTSRGRDPRPPNLIIILADDMGYGDVGCFGATRHRTPHLDRMAAEGIRLTSFYSASGVCSPSRASLMTGCYPRRVNLHQDEEQRWVLFPGSSTGLNPAEVTIAEVLKQAGYATAAIGKWHLGDQPEFLPTRQGFDSYFGLPYSNDMWIGNKRQSFPPLPLLRGETVIEEEPEQALLTKRYTEEAIRFIENHRDRPFFLYLAHTMPHVPVAASPPFAGKSANGAYGDAIEELDWSVGEIMKALMSQGIDEQTLVLFTSDNGAEGSRVKSTGPLRGGKGSTREGGMRVPCIVRWPGRLEAGRVCDELTSTLDLLPTFAKLAGAQLRSDRIIDGVDIWPVLSACAPSPRRALFYYARDQLQAVRAGKWKLHVPRKVEFPVVEDGATELPLRLYDLSQDPAEQTNLADQFPQVVERLQSLLEEAREDLGDGSRQGKNQRPAGRVKTPRFLTRKQEKLG
ncbi:MAG: sulfatase-like hydrolase/transferase [Acidobacteriota bacterium]